MDSYKKGELKQMNGTYRVINNESVPIFYDPDLKIPILSNGVTDSVRPEGKLITLDTQFKIILDPAIANPLIIYRDGNPVAFYADGWAPMRHLDLGH